jgi:RNA polymerase sigma factor (sigma-70 family)
MAFGPRAGAGMASCAPASAVQARPLLSTTDLSDDALVQACRAGQQGAWATLVRRFQRLVYTVPRRAGLSEAQAADVFQTAFQRLHEHLHRIDDASRVRAWLVTTAKRESLRLLAEGQRQVDLTPAADEDGDGAGTDPLDRLPDPAPLQDEQLAALQELARMRQAVDRLDPRSRQFVELLFLQDEPLPYAEIAARLGIAEGSIGPTRARCLAKLRKLMQDL